MRRSYITTTLIAAIVLVQLTAHAQTEASATATATAQPAAASTVTAQAPAAAAPSQAVQSPSLKNEVTVVTSTPQTVTQTTAVVTDPSSNSVADSLRKARERAEAETEQGILGKLEQDRFAEEQKRRDALVFQKQQAAEGSQVAGQDAAAGKATVSASTNGANSPATATTTIITNAGAPAQSAVVVGGDKAAVVVPPPVVQPPIAQPQPPVVVAPPIVVPPPPAPDCGAPGCLPPPPAPRHFNMGVGAMLGTMNYPDAYNTYSDFGMGVSFSWRTPQRINWEGSFMWSQHTLDDTYSLYKEVDQQNWAISGEYAFLAGTITPVVGGIVSYTRRDYTDMYDWGYGTSVQGYGSASSDSLDVGFKIGVEFAVVPCVVLGVDYRYMTNLATHYSDPETFNRSIYQSASKNYRPLEDIDYDMVVFTAKYLF